jgi:transcriptional regulator with XRE-family HTH domain
MEALRQYLQDHRITQAAFAADLKVSQPTVCGWLNGEQFPSGQNLRLISQRTGISIDRLLDVETSEAKG